MQTGSHLAEMMFFYLTQIWKFHRNDHNGGILLKGPVLASWENNSYTTNPKMSKYGN